MSRLQKVKNILAGLLLVPVITFGSVVALPMVASAQAAETSIGKGLTAAKTDDQVDSLFDEGGVFQKIINTALFIIGALSVLMLIYGGIRYTVSAGDSKQVESAKNTIMYAIIGIVVALLAYAIVNFVLSSLIGK